MTERMLIVVAWTAEDRVWDGKPRRADLGERAGTVALTTPHACVWLRRGVAYDLEMARKFSGTHDTGRVYAYVTSEEDPLGKARADILAGKPSTQGS